MLIKILKRCVRQPLVNGAILLFAAVMAVVLCFLHREKKLELESYEAVFSAIPVFCKVTDLDGSRVSAPGGIEGWVVSQFTGKGVKPLLEPYVGSLHTRVSYRGATWEGNAVTLVGITSTYVAEELTAGWGGRIDWIEGYDESILMEKEFVCIVPELLREETALELRITGTVPLGDKEVPDQDDLVDIRKEFKVVGTYTDPGNRNIYCSGYGVEWIYGNLKQTKPVEELGIVLKDNRDLEALREDAAKWFATPNPTGALTEWGRWGNDYFTFALDINDSMLRSLSESMQSTVRLNRIAAALVFLLSAGAGALIGFLILRARKREILLMRTLGASNVEIYKELTLEQLLCIGGGILVGGSYGLWQPVVQLLVFCAAYWAGLTAAMKVFLRRNLLTAIKEEE